MPRMMGALRLDRIGAAVPRLPPVAATRARTRAGLPAAPERLQPLPDHAPGLGLDGWQAAGAPAWMRGFKGIVVRRSLDLEGPSHCEARTGSSVGGAPTELSDIARV